MSIMITNNKKRSRRAIRATPATQTVQISVPKGSVKGASKNRTRTRRARQRNQVTPMYQQPAKPCTINYMKCLLDPFNCTAEELPCIPDLYDFPSKKFFTRQRGTFQTGTQSYGFIQASPENVSNDINNLSYTTNTFAGTTFPAAAATGVQGVTNTQSPFASASTPNYRVVAAGLRVRYQGTELARSGQIIPCRALTPADDLRGLSLAAVMGRSDVTPGTCDRRWHGCVYNPGSADAYNWKNTNKSSLTDVSRLGVMVTSASGAGIQYEYDYVVFYEAISEGAVTLDGMTRSHSDLTGLGYVRDFLGGLTASDVGQSAVNAGLSYLKSYAGPAAPLLEYFGPSTPASKIGRVKISGLA